ncbi:MAG: two-component system response regulator [Alphaproteobacteria bacterium]
MTDQNASPSPHGIRQYTILVIDDEPVNAHLISQLVQEHEVIVALNGTDGINMALDQRPDLILLDINMPDMLGFEVCRRLRMDPTMQDVPIIFNTTLDATEDKIRGFEAGGVDYVVKPYAKEEVVARINTHLSLRAAKLDLESQNRQLLRYKGVLEQLVVERISGTAGHPPREGDYGSLITILETVAQLDEGHRATSHDPEVVKELDSTRSFVRDVIRSLGPRLRRLRELLAAATPKSM